MSFWRLSSSIYYFHLLLHHHHHFIRAGYQAGDSHLHIHSIYTTTRAYRHHTHTRSPGDWDPKPWGETGRNGHFICCIISMTG